MTGKRKTDLVLLGLTFLFLAGTYLLYKSMPREQAQEPERVYYLTACEDPSQLLAVQVSNASGTLTMVHDRDMYITDTSMPGIRADEAAVQELFEAVYRLRAGDPIEGADPKDSQFGLTSPAATVLIENTDESGIQFLVGNLTPDGQSYYICTAGGGEVYTLPARMREFFLEDIRRYLDLRVFDGIDASYVTGICVLDEVGVRYELEAEGSSDVTGARYFTLTQPAVLPVPLSAMNSGIFASLEETEALDVQSAADGMDEAGSRTEAVIRLAGGEELRYRAGQDEDGSWWIWDLSNERILKVEQLPDWMKADAAGILGGKLLSLDAAAVSQIDLTTEEGSTGFTPDEADSWTRLLEKLDHITIEALQNGRTDTGEEVLRCTIHRKGGRADTKLVFLKTENRKCIICVNTRAAFTCALSSVDPIISESTGTS